MPTKHAKKKAQARKQLAKYRSVHRKLQQEQVIVRRYLEANDNDVVQKLKDRSEQQ